VTAERVTRRRHVIGRGPSVRRRRGHIDSAILSAASAERESVLLVAAQAQGPSAGRNDVETRWPRATDQFCSGERGSRRAGTLAVLQVEVTVSQFFTDRPTARGKSLPKSFPKYCRLHPNDGVNTARCVDRPRAGWESVP
jgi:hypothetical protein